MTNKEIIFLFKRKHEMNEREWYLFCNRYATRNVSSVITYIKALCKEEGVMPTNSFRPQFIEELKKGLKEKESCTV